MTSIEEYGHRKAKIYVTLQKKNEMISSNIIQSTNHHDVHMLIDPFPYGSPRMIWKPTSSKKHQQHTNYAYENTSFAFLKT